MNFMDAVNNMQAGKRLIRTGWSGIYLTILSGQDYIWQIGTSNETPNVISYRPTVSDIYANDWIVKS